jgi:ribosomal protein L12E/L44/L45/RPP1/RPP2
MNADAHLEALLAELAGHDLDALVQEVASVDVDALLREVNAAPMPSAPVGRITP